MYMVMFVLDDPHQLNDLLESWEKVGITGVTIIDSTGFQRVKAKARRRIPMRFRFQPVALEGEEGNLSLFTIVKNEEMVYKAEKAAEDIVGNLDQPNTGILASWPLFHTKGIPLEK